MFQSIPLNVTGPTYESRSRPLSSQETLNFYQEINEGGEENYVLMPWPGQTLISSVTGKDRGITQMAGVLYRVCDSTLYKIQGSQNIALGSIPGSFRCTFANDGINLFIANGTGSVYWYDGVNLQTVTDPDIVGALTVDFINNQFIYTKPDLTVISTVGDGSTADGLDAIGAESNPDNLQRDFVFNEEILRFGTHTLERWFNTGVGQPPIERLQGQTQQVGLASKYSIAKTSRAYYFLGDDRLVYQGQQGQAVSVTPPGIANTLEKASNISSAVGFTCTFQGQNFYILNLDGMTLGLNESLGSNGWFTLGNNGYNITSMLYLNGVNYACSGGDLVRLDISNPTHQGQVVTRRRVTQSINGDIFNRKGEQLQMTRFELIAEMGIGNNDSEDPLIQIETSIDGGKSFQHEDWVRLGRLGETDAKAEWFSNKVFYDLIIRITITEPVLVFIRSAVIELRLTGR